MSLLAENTSLLTNLETSIDPDYAQRFRALQEPLKPPVPLTLKQIWQITAALIHAARVTRKAELATEAASDSADTRP